MKHIFWIFVAVYSMLTVVACSKSSNNNNSAVTVTCPSGSTYNGYGCVNANGQVVSVVNNGPGFLGYFADNWSAQKSVTILDQTAFREFLRTAMGVCDRMQYSGGTADCTSWINGGFDVVMMVPDINNPNTINITFRAWPSISAYGYYSYSAPGISGLLGSFFGIPSGANAGGYFDPMSLSSWTVSIVNTSQGFEARSYGPLYSFGNRSLIQVRVDQGKLGDGSFAVKFGYPNCVQDSTHTCSNPTGVWFAQGTFSRCQSANCSGGLW